MAKPAPAPTEQHTPIQQAYRELKTPAFSVWIRLMVATDEELGRGRRALSDLLGYSEQRFNAILRELKHSGYIKLIRGYAAGKPTRVVIIRRALLAGRDRFVKLSSILYDAQTGNAQALLTDRHQAGVVPGTPPTVADQSASEAIVASVLSEALVSVKTPTKIPPKDWHVGGVLNSQHETYFHQSKIAQTLGSSSEKKPRTEKSGEVAKAPIKKTKCLVFGEVPGIGSKTGGSSEKLHGSSLDLRKIRDQRAKKKEQEKENRRAKAEARRQRAEGRGVSATPGEVNWAKVAAPTIGGVTFTPSKKERERYIALLSRKPGDPNRIKFVNKLTRIFSIEYVRYMIMRTGRDYLITTESQRKYARQAAELCLINALTPRQLIRYWDKNMDSFHAAASMKYPPLSFISSSWAVEQAAVAVIDGKGKLVAKKAPKVEQHGFSDTTQLDKTLKRRLLSAGFDEAARKTDQELLHIQKVATDNARGAHLWIQPSIRPMVGWITKHLVPTWLAAEKGVDEDED